MKIYKIILPLLFVLKGCSTYTDIPQNKVTFKSKGFDIDILGISGLDMGSMYSSESYTPKNVGDKTYVSYHTVKLSEKINIRWKLSHQKNIQTQETTITRPESIPPEIPSNSNLTFLYTGSKWELHLAL